MGGVPHHLRTAGRARGPAALLLTRRDARRARQPAHREDRRLAGRCAGWSGDGHEQLGRRPADLAARSSARDTRSTRHATRSTSGFSSWWRRIPRSHPFSRLYTELWQVPAAGRWRAGVRHLRLQSPDVRHRALAQRIADNFPRSLSRSSIGRRGTWPSFPSDPGHPSVACPPSPSAWPSRESRSAAGQRHAGVGARVPGNAEPGERRRDLVERHGSRTGCPVPAVQPRSSNRDA